jgi:hypothetical protein
MPEPDLREVLELLKSGARLEAVRVLRKVTGQSLSEAEATLRKLAQPSGAPSGQGLFDVLAGKLRQAQAEREAATEAKLGQSTPAPPRAGAHLPQGKPLHAAPQASPRNTTPPAVPVAQGRAPFERIRRPRAGDRPSRALILLTLVAMAFFGLILAGLLASFYAGRMSAP